MLRNLGLVWVEMDNKSPIFEFFVLNSYSCTRGHNFKLNKPKCNNNARYFSFACRRIDVWNSLPLNVVSAVSINGFKNGISKIDFTKFLKYTV